MTDACQALRISQRTLYRRIDAGDIESKVENRRRLVLVTLPDVLPVADTTAGISDTEVLNQLRSEIDRLEGQIDRLEQQIDQQSLMIFQRQPLLQCRLSSWLRRLLRRVFRI